MHAYACPRVTKGALEVCLRIRRARRVARVAGVLVGLVDDLQLHRLEGCLQLPVVVAGGCGGVVGAGLARC